MSFSKSETKYKQAAKLRIKPQSDMLRQNAMRTKPSAKARHRGCPRTPRSCHEVTWVWTDPTRRAGGQTSPPGVLPGRTTATELTNVYFDILETSGMVEVIEGKLPTMEVTRDCIFVEGYRINPKRLGLSLGHDLSDESSGHKGFSLGAQTEVGTVNPIDGQAEAELYDITKETKSGLLTIKYPFAPFKCSACWVILESPAKLVEHMGTRHKEDFIQFSCSKCQKTMPKLKSIAIHYGKCSKGLIGRSARAQADKQREAVIVDAIRREVVSAENLVESPDSSLGGSDLDQRTSATTSVEPASVGTTPPTTGVAETGGRDDNDSLGTVNAHKCDVCSATFGSKSGLGQHVRHRHPNLANELRLQAAKKDIERKRAARQAEKAKQSLPIAASSKSNSSWTDEEVCLLLELEEQFKGEKRINVAISKLLISKTHKQIATKRKQLAARKTPVIREQARTEQNQAAPVTGQVPTPNIHEYWEHCQTSGGPLVGESAEVLYKIAYGEHCEDSYSSLLSKVVEHFSDPVGKDKKRKKGGGRAKPRNQRKRASEKVNLYRKHQDLYRKDKKALASLILDGKEVSDKCGLDPTLVEATYQERFGGKSQDVDLSSYPGAKPADNWTLLKPFSPREIRDAFKRAKKDTAAGPDGIEVKSLIAKDPEGCLLANLFNSFLARRKVPELFKHNRSILLPKGSEGLEDVNNWRPLTISSVVLRLYTNLLARRVLSTFDLNPRQRGFIAASGCSENSFLLSEMIEHAKKNHDSLCVTFLDLAKAFDTVSHRHIVAGLRRFQASEQFVEMIEDLYSGASTVFQTSAGETGRIPITRGVKQGDPLSPLLFNIAMDPLLAELTARQNGFKFGPEEGDRMESLCYADDNALCTNSPAEMNSNLEAVAAFCDQTGMRLNIKKSACFTITPCGSKTYTVNLQGEAICIRGEAVPVIPPDSSMKYLGSKMSPWVTKIRKDLVAQLSSWVNSIGEAKLKPRQKLVLLNHYALARLNYPLTQDAYPMCILRRLDQVVRTAVRSWVKLPDCSPTAMFYLSRSEGGLGLPELSKSIPAQRINMLRGISRSSDAKIRRMTEVMQTPVLVEKIAALAELTVPEDPKGRVRWRRLVSKAALKLKIGKAAKSFQFTESNTWLNPSASYFTESDYITGVALRNETYPCKATLARGRQGVDVRCRHCHLTAETVGHISGACPKVKDYRIKRHNAIVDCVTDKCKSAGWLVTTEPKITLNGQVYKPDLILVRENKAVVIDPTIVYEADHTLQRANRAKTIKYSPLVEKICDMYKVTEVEVKGLAIGARGGWCQQNTATLQELGIEDRGFSSHLCRLALKGTINLVRLFMDQ